MDEEVALKSHLVSVGGKGREIRLRGERMRVGRVSPLLMFVLWGTRIDW